MRLDGKTILFVDDRFDVTRFFIDRARQEGARVEHRRTILGAYERLREGPCDFAVLDLHMQMPAVLPPELQEFGDSFDHVARTEELARRRLNAGQILGMYINAKRDGRPPFLYLSAVAMHYVPLPGGEPIGRLPCFDKYDCDPAALLDVIVDCTR